MALSCLVLFVVSTAVLVAWHPHSHIYACLIGYLVLSALLLMVGTIAVSLTIARTKFELSELRLLIVPEVVIVFGMSVAVVLSTLLIGLITVHAPQLFSSQDVNSTMFITGVLFMALGTIFALMGLRHGAFKDFSQLTRG